MPYRRSLMKNVRSCSAGLRGRLRYWPMRRLPAWRTSTTAVRLPLRLQSGACGSHGRSRFAVMSRTATFDPPRSPPSHSCGGGVAGCPRMDRWGEPNSDREYAAAAPGAPRRLIRTTIQETPHIAMQNFDVARGKTDHATSKGDKQGKRPNLPAGIPCGSGSRPDRDYMRATRRTGPSISPQTPSGREAISLRHFTPELCHSCSGLFFGHRSRAAAAGIGGSNLRRKRQRQGRSSFWRMQ